MTRARAVATATLVAEREPEHAYAVGQRAIRAGYSLKVTRVLECTGEHGQRPGRDQLWLGLELVAAALGPGSFAIGHSHARLVDGRGRVSAPLLLAKTEQCEPLLKYTRLAPGSQVAGWIVFAIPREAETLTLQVSPRAYLNEPPTLFKLGR